MSPLRSILRSCPSGVALLLAPLALISGCYQLPKAQGYDVEVHDGALAERNPRDVSIGPVLVVHGDARVPDWALRRGFQKALVKRRYSPLALEHVDQNLVDASYRAGRLDEDASLEIVVYAWDESQWNSRSVITFDLEARLVDPSGSSVDPLWAGRLEKRMEFAATRDTTPSSRVQMESACEGIANEILAALPARRVEPGS